MYVSRSVSKFPPSPFNTIEKKNVTNKKLTFELLILKELIYVSHLQTILRPDIVSTLRSEVHKTVRTICFPLVESRIEFWNVASIQEKFFYLYFLERVKLEEKE